MAMKKWSQTQSHCTRSLIANMRFLCTLAISVKLFSHRKSPCDILLDNHFIDSMHFRELNFSIT